MKKYLLTILITVVIVLNCSAQRKIKKIEVEEVGFNIKLNLIPKTNELNYNNLKIKITPLSTSSLNEKFLTESNFNGKFEYSHYKHSRNSFFLKKSKKKREKSDFEFLLDGVDWLVENNKINNQEYNELVKQIIFSYDSERGKEIYSTQKNISCNPYYIGDKYLNIFEIEFSNQTKTYQKFDKKLLIETGNLLLYPLSKDEIIEKLIQNKLLNQDKIQTLYRYNLSNEIIIPPNSTFIKYFAIVPINYDNNELKVSFEGLNSKFKWTIDKDYESIDKKYTFFELSTKWYYGDYTPDVGNNFCILNAPANIYISNGVIFIEDKNLNDEFEIISLSIYNDRLYFGRTKLKGIDYIELEKGRRKEILIKPTKIDELKKKVKQ